MSLPLSLHLVDPDLAADEALNAPDPDPALLTPEDIDRRVRALRWLRLERDDLAERFDRELDRISDARDRHVGTLDLRIEQLERLLTSWFGLWQDTEAAAGRDPRKSWPCPDGVIKSRRSSHVEVETDPVGIAALPGWLTRTTVAVDKTAAKNAALDDDGRVVDPDTGEVFPVRVVEQTNYRVETE